MPIIWLDGEVLDPGDAVVPVFDHGLTVGDGAFETLRTERGVPFAMRRHLDRLRRSLERLGIPLEVDDDVLREAMCAVADSWGVPARVRLTVTAGNGPLGSGRDDGPSTVFVAGSAFEARGETEAVVTVPWRRNEFSAIAGVKSTSYAENVVALQRARDAGAGEALLANTAGELCEGTGSNVFVVLDGEVVTPPLSSGCLAGVTREILLDHVTVAEQPLPFDVLDTADEVFLTSSTRDVMGVHRVDDRALDAPGPVTRRMAEVFATVVAGDLDP